MERQTLSIILLLVTCSVWAGAATVGSLDSMRMLTRDAGWAANAGRLFSTVDGGLHWKDITPKADSAGSLAAVFFLDPSNGWVLLGHSRDIPGADLGPDTQFDLASTTDGGTSWSIVKLEIPHAITGRGLSEHAWVTFVDPLHGWVMGQENGSLNTSGGILVTTQDGGKSWQQPSGEIPAAGSLRFVTPTKGFLADYRDSFDEGFYGTSDGGNSWQLVSVASPPLVSSASVPAYSLPVFEDSIHGILQVGFSGPNSENPLVALYASNDGGQTWQFIEALPQGPSVHPLSTVAGSAFITVAVSGQMLVLTTTRAGRTAAPSASASADVSNIIGPSSVRDLSFVDAQSGWVLVYGKLLSTKNGGATWVDVTPPGATVIKRTPTAPSLKSKPIRSQNVPIAELARCSTPGI